MHYPQPIFQQQTGPMHHPPSMFQQQTGPMHNPQAMFQHQTGPIHNPKQMFQQQTGLMNYTKPNGPQMLQETLMAQPIPAMTGIAYPENYNSVQSV